MFSANSFSESEDRPLIVQLSGHDPQKLLASALIIETGKYGVVDAVDINIGCPQGIAKRGHYGAFLMEELDLLNEIVSLMTSKLTSLAVTCKSRIYKTESGEVDMARTVRLYETLIKAGAKMITVHCRTRDEKGFLVARADWHAIAKLVEYFDGRVPIIANGGIETLEDYYECLRVTGADGVMSAEGVLENPALFQEPADADPDILVRGRRFPTELGPPDLGLGDFPMRQLLLTRAYLEFCRCYNYQHAALMRSHIIKMLYRYTSNFRQLTDFIIRASTVGDYEFVLNMVEEVAVQSCLRRLVGDSVEVHVTEYFVDPTVRKKFLVMDFGRMEAELRATGVELRAQAQSAQAANPELQAQAQARMAGLYHDQFHVSWYNRHRDPTSKTAPQNRPSADEVLHKIYRGRNNNVFWNSEEEVVPMAGEDECACGGVDAEAEEEADASLFAIFGMSESYC